MPCSAIEGAKIACGRSDCNTPYESDINGEITLIKVLFIQ